MGVLLAMFRDAWSFYSQVLFGGKEPPGSLSDHIISALVEWLRGEKSADGRRVIVQFGGMPFQMELSPSKGRVVAIILGKAAQHQALLKRHPSEGLIPDKLVSLFNDYLRHLRDKTRKRVLLLVDHVDKIRDETAARETLVDTVSHWGRLDASLVMTAPYEFTLGEFRASVEGYWGRPLVLYPEPIPEFGRPLDVTSEKMGFYKRIRSAAGLDGRLADEDLQLLAYYSGGIPRYFILLLSAAIKNAIFEGEERLRSAHVEVAISEARSDYKDYQDSDLAVLDEIVRTQQGLGRAMRLLRSPVALIVEPLEGGGNRFRAHPLAEESLRLYRERHATPTLNRPE